MKIVTCSRHFVFVKNEFLLIRDSIVAHEPLDVTLASVFNSQNIDASISPPAALAYMSQPAAFGVGLLNPAVDLLIYHCPQKDLRLVAADRTVTDPRAKFVRGQLRYEWSGQLGGGETRRFATLFRPQRPVADKASVSSNPASGSEKLLPGFDAGSIEVHLDDDIATVLRMQDNDGREQWVIANPMGKPINTSELQTDARAAYIELHRDAMVRTWSYKASTIRFNGKELSLSASPLTGKIP